MVKSQAIKSLMALMLVFLVQTSYAADATGPAWRTYDLRSLEKLVVEKDAGVESAHHLVNSVKGELGETKSSFGPDVNFQYTYGPHDGKITRDIIHKEHQIKARMEQDLMGLLKVRSGETKAVEAELEGVKAELKEAERAAIFELREEYIDILEEKIQADSYLRIKDIYQDLLAIFKRRQMEKEALHSDVLEVEWALVEAKESFLTYRNNFESSKNLLALSLGLMADEIEIKDIEPLPPLPSEEKLVQATLNNRGEIKLFEANAKKEEAIASIAGVDEIETRVFGGYRLRKNKEGHWRSGPEVGISVEIPLAYRSIRNNRHKRYMEAKRFWESEARNVAGDIKKEIRLAYERYSLENIRSLNAEKGLELKQEEMRIERARLDNAVSTVKADRANLLRLRAEEAELEMEKRLAEYEKIKSYYELLFLAGVSQPEELEIYNYTGGPSRRKPYARALWVWDVKGVVESDEKEDFFVSFCKAKGIERVFLSVNRLMAETLTQNTDISNLITKLHRDNIKVSALFGDNVWVYPGRRGRLINRIQTIVAYNVARGRRARFDGIHLDIEPHTLREWDAKKQELLNMLLETYEVAKAQISADSSGLLLEVDIPVFYEKTDPVVLKKIAETVDIMTIMAYKRKTPEKVVGAVQAEMDAVIESGKGIIVGLNAKDFSDEARLEELIVKVGDRLSVERSFLGFSIHDFDSYRTLATR
ncbi:MAG: TolC family protein [Candidatus Brocadiales bacterium]